MHNEVDINGIKIGYKHPPKIMGVLNLSPESFFQGSVIEADDLANGAKQMEKDGAHILDIGGASTAPKDVYGTIDVSEEIEEKRVREALEIIADEITVPISVDTSSARVAETALDLGASIINDVTGLQSDEKLSKLIVSRDVPVVIMASGSDLCTTINESITALKRSLEIAHNAGIPDEHIIVDPGIGFGKPPEIDFAILRELNRFRCLGFPILVGVSRKAFIGFCLDQENSEDRLVGTIAATSIAIEKGADIVRAHDVREAVAAAKIGYAIRDRAGLSSSRSRICMVANEIEVELILERIGVGDDIRSALAKKGVMLNIFVDGIDVPAALILKQEMLALGGDAAYHHDTIDSTIKHTDMLLMGTPVMFDRLVKKSVRMDYFGIKEIGVSINDILQRRTMEH